MSKSDPAVSKPKLTAAQQIEAMARNGIRFDLFPKERAEVFLCRRNYFFKLKAFCKNFNKWRMPDGSDGGYMDLDFAYLVELSKLDMHLRALVLRVSLDIEHFLKVRINEAVMSDPRCDGYRVVADFLRFDEERKTVALENRLSMQVANQAAERMMRFAERISAEARKAHGEEPASEAVVKAFDEARSLIDGATGGTDLHHIEHSIAYLGTSTYSRKVAMKYGDADRMAVWNLLELASFGDVIAFYKYYFIEYAEHRDPTAKSIKSLLFPAKTLRNAAAHNNCLLNGLRDRLSSPVGAIAKTLREEYGYDAEKVAGTRRVPLIHDLSALLICYDRVVEGPGIRRERAREMRMLKKRLLMHKDYFEKQFEVVAALDFIAALLEGFAASLECPLSTEQGLPTCLGDDSVPRQAACVTLP